MSDSTLAFLRDHEDGFEIVVNFGVFSGREATPAEVDRLGEELLATLESVEIVCEHRYELARSAGAVVYQVCIRAPADGAVWVDELLEIAERWAQDAIAERHVAEPLDS